MFNKKIMWLVCGIALIMLASLIVFPFLNQGNQSVTSTETIPSLIPQGLTENALTWNNITLTDFTEFDEETNTCTASRFGMEITIYPCVAQDPNGIDITQYVNFSWTGGQVRNTSWIFVYENQLEDFTIDIQKNESYTYNETIIGDVWASTLVQGVTGSVDLGDPIGSACDWGNINNTHMRNVTWQNATGTFNTVYCFTDFEDLGMGNYNASGNIWGNVEIEVEDTRLTWDDVSNRIEYLGEDLLGNGYDFYKVSEAQFNPNQTRVSRWTFTPENHTGVGKWHILGYESETGWQDAIINDQYIYLDPWWNNDWSYQQEVAVNEINGVTGHVGEPFPVVFDTATLISQGKLQTDCGDLRAIFDDGATESLANVTGCGNTTAIVWVNNTHSFSSGESINISFYYGNPSATADAYTISRGDLGFNATDIAYNDSSPRFTISPDADAYTYDPAYADSFPATPYCHECSLANLFWDTAFVVSGNVSFLKNYTLGWFEVLGDADGGKQLNNASVAYWDYNAKRFVNVTTMTPTPNAVYTNLTMLNQMGYSDVWQIVGYTLGTGSAEVNFLGQRFYSPHILSATPIGSEEQNVGIYTDLLEPPNEATLANGTVDFLVNSTAGVTHELQNVTIWIFNSTGSTIYEDTQIITGVNTTVTTSWQQNLSNGDYLWSAETSGNATDTGIVQNTLAGNFTFGIDTQVPVLTLNQNITGAFTNTFPVSVILNYTATDANLGNCWYITSDNATENLITCNQSTQVNFTTGGVKTISYFANDTYGNDANGSVSFEIGTYAQNVDDPVTAEGDLSVFTLEFNKTNISSETVTAFLNWNNTNYAPTAQVSTQNRTLLTTKLIIPVGTGNTTGNFINWSWMFNVTNVVNTTNTETQTQTVYSPSLSDCSAGGTIILNFTHYLEDTQELVNYTNGNNLQVDLSLKSLFNDDVEFVYNSTEVDSPELIVCIVDEALNTTSYKFDLTGSYVGTDLVQEFFYIDNGTITNANVPQVYPWYDLLLADSTTFLFTFLNENGLEVPGVIVETYRYYIGQGEFLEVERSKEDDNGETHIHLVEEDVIYKFRVTLENQEVFFSDQYNAKCLSSPCAITLSAEPDVDPFPEVYNNLPEGSYAITTDKGTREVTLAFNLNQTATMNLSVWTQNNNEAEAVASGTTTASSGSVVVSVPLQYANATYSAVIYHNDDFVATRVVDLSESANDYFGALGLFLGALAVLCLALIGASHGEWVIVWTILGMVTASMLYLVDLTWYALMTFIAGAGVFLIKLVSRRRVG